MICISPIAGIVPCADTISDVFVPLSDILATVCVEQGALTLHVIFMPSALILLAIFELHRTLSLPQTVDPFANVYGSIRPFLLTFALNFALMILALIDAPVSELLLTFSVLLVFDVLTFVYAAVRPPVDAVTMLAAIEPLATVSVTIR